jgi:hypothetical protein
MTFISLALPLTPAVVAFAMRLYLSAAGTIPNDSLDAGAIHPPKA